MSAEGNRTDLPVLMLHNLDPAWLSGEIEEAIQGVQAMESALRALGHPVTSVPISDADLFLRLRDFDPDKYILPKLSDFPFEKSGEKHLLGDRYLL